MASSGRNRRESVNLSLKKLDDSKMQKTPQNQKIHQDTDARYDQKEIHTQIEAEFSKFKVEIRSFFKEFDSKMDEKLTKIDSKFSNMFEEMKKEMREFKNEVQDVKGDIQELKVKSVELEESVDFLDKRYDERVDSLKSMIEKQDVAMQEIERQFMIQEKHDRHYNLLFYGFREEQNETYETLDENMRSFFKRQLNIEEDKVNDMEFANIHRLPSFENRGPRPIIIKFLAVPDRDLVFSRANSPALRQQRKRILSDLPVPMKRERGRLAKAAYDIRTNEHLQTRITERGLSVVLEVRRNSQHQWERRDIH